MDGDDFSKKDWKWRGPDKRMFCKAIADGVGIRLDGLGGLTQCHFWRFDFQWSDWFGECSPSLARVSKFDVMVEFRVSCHANLNSGTC